MAWEICHSISPVVNILNKSWAQIVVIIRRQPPSVSRRHHFHHQRPNQLIPVHIAILHTPKHAHRPTAKMTSLTFPKSALRRAIANASDLSTDSNEVLGNSSNNTAGRATPSNPFFTRRRSNLPVTFAGL